MLEVLEVTEFVLKMSAFERWNLAHDTFNIVVLVFARILNISLLPRFWILVC